jgi:alcohol dehydrogenase (cytochrome c)
MTPLTSARKTVIKIIVVVAVTLVAAVASTHANWRLAVISLKVSGELADLPWSDLLTMIKPGSGIWLQPLVDLPNPYSVIHNPDTTAHDIATGKALFRYRCESCHGLGAQGGTAPGLVGRDLTHGSSDWAVFRTVRDGIGGTAMLPHDLPSGDLWRLVAYIQDRSSMHEADGALRSDAALGKLQVRSESLRGAQSASGDWPTYYGSYNGHRFSSLANINRNNVVQLQARWIREVASRSARIEASPISAGGRLFLTDPQGGVIALDAATGVQLWRHAREPSRNVMLCCVTANRGVAVLDDKVFVATLDAHLMALDGGSGKVLWDVTIANYKDGYSSTGAPLVVKGMVVTGVAGSEFGVPGFVAAYDAMSGRLLWRFQTIPKSGEKGNASWAGESWRTGGVATWMTGTYDPTLDLIYWGTGNPAPDFDSSARPGDNLYSNSVVALKADTGELAWYFQYNPGDDHDWDSVEAPVLVDLPEGTQTRKLLLTANRDGFFYALDRTNGKFLWAVPFVQQTWAAGIDPSGRPIRRPEASGSERGTLVYPGVTGGTSRWPPTFYPAAQLFIVPAIERPGFFFTTPRNERFGDQELLGGISGATMAAHFTAVRAMDPHTGAMRWEHRFGARHVAGDLCGLLSTAGGLVFTSDQDTLVALDAADGHLVWSFQAGAGIHSPPTTYLVGSEQFIVFVAGDVVIGLALPPPLPAASNSPPRSKS